MTIYRDSNSLLWRERARARALARARHGWLGGGPPVRLRRLNAGQQQLLRLASSHGVSLTH
jgi:hypothetical protein